MSAAISLYQAEPTECPAAPDLHPGRLRPDIVPASAIGFIPAGGQGYDLKKAYPNCKWGLMDLQGKVIIPDSLYDFIFQIWIEDRYLYGVEKEGRYSVLDPVTWQPVVRWKEYTSPEELVEAYKKAVSAHR